jgi:hypothetical protein
LLADLDKKIESLMMDIARAHRSGCDPRKEDSDGSPVVVCRFGWLVTNPLRKRLLIAHGLHRYQVMVDCGALIAER